MLGEAAQIIKQLSCYCAALEALVQQKDETIKALQAELDKKAKPAKE